MTSGSRIAAMLVVAATTMLTACQRPLAPVVPAGDAGYTALETAAADAGTAKPYGLAAGDVIAVRVYEEAELSVEEVAIDNAGRVALPLIGEMSAAGRTAAELAGEIEAAYGARYLRDPRVTVLIRRGRAATIAVEGEVEQPGVFPYAEGQTLLTALALARSPTETAKLDEVMVFRTTPSGRAAGRFDLRAIRGGRADDVALLPGDVVVVGYSTLRGTYQDVIRAVPILGVFRPFP